VHPLPRSLPSWHHTAAACCHSAEHGARAAERCRALGCCALVQSNICFDNVALVSACFAPVCNAIRNACHTAEHGARVVHPLPLPGSPPALARNAIEADEPGPSALARARAGLALWLPYPAMPAPI
jgi:hypothetical protein